MIVLYIAQSFEWNGEKSRKWVCCTFTLAKAASIDGSHPPSGCPSEGNLVLRTQTGDEAKVDWSGHSHFKGDLSGSAYA